MPFFAQCEFEVITKLFKTTVTDWKGVRLLETGSAITVISALNYLCTGSNI